MIGDQIPAVVGGDHPGSMGLSALMHGLSDATTLTLWVGLLLSAVTLVLVLVNFFRRGRLHAASWAVARFLIALPAVMAVYAAASVLLGAFLRSANLNQDVSAAAIAPELAEAAFVIAAAAMTTGLGVVLCLILRLQRAWRRPAL